MEMPSVLTAIFAKLGEQLKSTFEAKLVEKQSKVNDGDIWHITFNDLDEVNDSIILFYDRPVNYPHPSKLISNRLSTEYVLKSTSKLVYNEETKNYDTVFDRDTTITTFATDLAKIILERVASAKLNKIIYSSRLVEPPQNDEFNRMCFLREGAKVSKRLVPRVRILENTKIEAISSPKVTIQLGTDTTNISEELTLDAEGLLALDEIKQSTIDTLIESLYTKHTKRELEYVNMELLKEALTKEGWFVVKRADTHYLEVKFCDKDLTILPDGDTWSVILPKAQVSQDKFDSLTNLFTVIRNTKLYHNLTDAGVEQPMESEIELS